MGGSTTDATRGGMHLPVSGEDREHLPPMGRHPRLIPLYDPLTRLFGVGAVHRQLLGAAAPRPGQRVVEIGCGTGNLALLAKARVPGATVVGLDPDFAALARAQHKGRRRGLAVQWDHGFADRLPYADAGFDRVLSAFMLHHLPAAEKPAALREVVRVLRPGGELHLVDFGGEPGGPGHGHGLGGRARRHPQLQDQYGDAVPALLRDAGFTHVTGTRSELRFVGPVTTYRAVR